MKKTIKVIGTTMGVIFIVLWTMLFILWVCTLVAYIFGVGLDSSLMERGSAAFGVWVIMSFVALVVLVCLGGWYEI